MGSSHSKPEKNNKNGKIGQRKAPTMGAPVYLTHDIEPAPSANFANTGGIHSLPATPMVPITPTTRDQRRISSAPGTIHVQVHELEGHSNVTRPPPPPRLRHLSELIDPNDIPRNAHLRSPSGQILGAEEYLAREDRPLSLRERREEVLRRVRTISAEAQGAAAGDGTGLGIEQGENVRPTTASLRTTAANVRPTTTNVKPTATNARPTATNAKTAKKTKKAKPAKRIKNEENVALWRRCLCW